ncbi:N-glycosylase/DNA lyase [Panus rudis PR-1116 ss-1]|nr:N-glycosylase/DNA lyase [Panus rudis PR-1116 ss-1]
MSIPSGFKSLPLPLSQLSLAAVLQCGQSFRWSIFPLRIPNIEPTVPAEATPQYEYRLCLRDRVVCLRQSPDMLFYRSVFPSPALSPTEELQRESETVSWIRDYFQLGVDLMKLYEQWAEADPVFKRLQDRFEGIRMLRQDPFECLLSFICSSNNNIARITKMVKSLCTQYSPPLLKMAPPNADGLDEEVQPYYPFPRPSVLASPEVSAQLRSLGFGYRAEFIQRTAQILVEAHGVSMSSGDKLEPSERWLYTLRNLPTARAREELLKFVGVGRKVADCVMLMSLDKKEVIPVDTHVHQIAVKHYGLPGSNSKTKANMTPKLYDQVNSKLVAIWGDYAGWAHSVNYSASSGLYSAHLIKSHCRFSSRLT